MRRSKRETGNLKVGIRKGEASCSAARKARRKGGGGWVGPASKQASKPRPALDGRRA